MFLLLALFLISLCSLIIGIKNALAKRIIHNIRFKTQREKIIGLYILFSIFSMSITINQPIDIKFFRPIKPFFSLEFFGKNL